MLSVQITFSNGQKFEVPSKAIAIPRAEYYASRDGKKGSEDYMKSYEEELAMGLSTEDLLLDWIQNNMDWSDVRYAAKRLPMHDREVDFEKEFTNAKFEVLELSKPEGN